MHAKIGRATAWRTHQCHEPSRLACSRVHRRWRSFTEISCGISLVTDRKDSSRARASSRLKQKDAALSQEARFFPRQDPRLRACFR